MTDEELAAIRARLMKELQENAAKPAAPAPAEAPTKPAAVTDADFDRFVRTHEAVVVDLWAPWCGPCRIIGPMLDDLAQKYAGEVTVGKVNVDENPGTPGRFGVQGIPTLLFFKNGELVDRVVGAPPQAQLDAAFRRLAA